MKTTQALALASAAFIALRTLSQATVVYWDGNAIVPGAGSAPAGTWGTDGFWSADSTGASATAAWVSGDTAVFAAGTDATGAYTVTVSGTQNAAGITVEEGVVTLATGNVSLGAGTVTVSNGATLSTDSSLRIATTAGSVVTLDGGTLRTTNTGAAGTFFDQDSTITLGANGGTFSHTTANILNIVQTASKINGTGNLTKSGAGVLAFAATAGNCTYTGSTTVNEGEIRIRTVANTLPVTTALIVTSPGIFNLNGVSQQVGSLSGNGKVGTGSGTLTVGDSTDTTFSGTIDNVNNAGAGGTTAGTGKLAKVGTGALTLTGLNTYSGGFTLTAGTVTVDPAAMLCGSAATVAVNGGTLNLNQPSQSIGALSGTGGTINLVAGLVLTTDPAASSTYSGVIAGAGGIKKLNVASPTTMRTLALSGANTYDGPTTISGGNIAVGNATALGSTVSGTTVESGAELICTGAAVNFTINEPISLAGPGGSDGGAISVLASATPTFSGPITLAETSQITVSGTATLTFSNANSITAVGNKDLTLQGGSGAGGGGTILGTVALGTGGLTKLQGGQWTLAGTNTYTGTTTISAGTINVSG